MTGLKEIIKIAENTPLTVSVEGIGDINYIPLTVADLEEINQKPDEERGIYGLYLMLSRANPDIDYEFLKGVRVDVLEKIATAIGEQMDFRVRKHGLQ